MPQPRRPLGIINANIQKKKKELTPYKRGKIAGAKYFGHTASEIAAAFDINISTVKSTLRLDILRYDGVSRAGRGRKKDYSNREERAILRHVRLHLKDTYKDVKRDTGVDCSHTTIKRILQAYSISNWRAKKRPALTGEYARIRLA